MLCLAHSHVEAVFLAALCQKAIYVLKFTLNSSTYVFHETSFDLDVIVTAGVAAFTARWFLSAFLSNHFVTPTTFISVARLDIM